MRRKIALLFAAVLSFSLAVCGANNSADSSGKEVLSDSQKEAPAVKERDTSAPEESQAADEMVIKGLELPFNSRKH